MTVAERIAEHLKSLPELLQAEVLDFIEFLEARQESNDETDADGSWTAFSLSRAMEGMESESSSYSTDDLKAVF